MLLFEDVLLEMFQDDDTYCDQTNLAPITSAESDHLGSEMNKNRFHVIKNAGLAEPYD